MHPAQHGPDMRRHVIRPLEIVAIALRTATWTESCKRVLKIKTHVRISVLLNRQRRRGMLD